MSEAPFSATWRARRARGRTAPNRYPTAGHPTPALAAGVVVGSALMDRPEREGPAGEETLLSGLRVALDEGMA